MSENPHEPDSLIEEAEIEPVPGEDYQGFTPRPDLAGEASEYDVAEQARPAGIDDEPDAAQAAGDGSLGE